jgi:hypothetical protein
MHKESVNWISFQLRPEQIFESTDSRALTSLGSRFEGIKSIKSYLNSLESSNRDDEGKPVCSDEKRNEWKAEIDGKFNEIGAILGVEIPNDGFVRENLIWQHGNIVTEQLDTLHDEVIFTKGQ